MEPPLPYGRGSIWIQTVITRSFTATWAWVMSEVPVRASSADSLSVRSVERYHLGFIELDHPPKAYLPGRVPDDLRKSVAGTLIRSPSSKAAFKINKTLRSFRSSAISPPASKTIPFTRPALAWSCAFVPKASFAPTHVPSAWAALRFPLGTLPPWRGTQPHSPEISGRPAE